MKPVEMYTGKTCAFCWAAKALLDRKGIEYREIDISGDEALRDQMVERAGGRSTIPQIFIGDQHVGGYTDLARLEADGELDRMLGRD